MLSKAELITASRGNMFVRLKPGSLTAQVVRQLVAHGMDVHAICVEEQTLESFYLDLMKRATKTVDPALFPRRGEKESAPAPL